MILDTKLNFRKHSENMLTKVNKTIVLLQKLQNIFPQRSFVRSHLCSGNVIFDQSYNNIFHQKMESMQYNAVMAITGAIVGSSREKIYQELGLESLQQRDPTNTPLGFHVETTWKRSFPPHFNVKSTWCVRRVIV